MTHFALWAMSKAPLIIGADLTKIKSNSVAILKNQYLIAVNQDELGNQIKCVEGCAYDKNSSKQVWQSLILTDGVTLEMGVLAVNWDDEAEVDFDLDLVKLGIATKTTDECYVRDLWSGNKVQTTGKV